MNDINNLFFELIRVAIGNQVCLSRTPKQKEWQELYAMAKKQSLVGICFAGLQKLYNKDTQEPSTHNPQPDSTHNQEPITKNLDEVQYLKWMAMAAKIQQRNEMMNQRCVELQEKLANAGLASCVLKGQGVASLYGDLANLRQSGDIDLWVDAPKEKVVELARKTGSKDRASYLHVGARYFDDTDVELHYRPTYMRCLWHINRMQEWCESFKVSEGFRGFREVNGMIVPSDEFNVVYLLSHIYRHLFGLGIGMRQIMDYYFVLRMVPIRHGSGQASGFKASEVSGTLKHLGLYDFAGAVMWVLKEVYGLGRGYMICEPDECRGRALLEDIMESGNFGKGQKKMPTWLRKLKQWSRLVTMYPSETLSDPIWRVYMKMK